MFSKDEATAKPPTKTCPDCHQKIPKHVPYCTTIGCHHSFVAQPVQMNLQFVQ